MHHCLVGTEPGDLVLAASDRALTGLWFPEHRYPPTASALGDRVDARRHRVLARAGEQLHEYLAGDRRRFDLPVSTTGTDLSQRVWTLLREIPCGRTTTYGRIAVQLGDPHLAQRVGQAVGHNPVSIVIPCHRVVGADGSLTGFAGGLVRKRHLLEVEEPDEAAAARLF